MPLINQMNLVQGQSLAPGVCVCRAGVSRKKGVSHKITYKKSSSVRNSFSGYISKELAP